MKCRFCRFTTLLSLIAMTLSGFVYMKTQTELSPDVLTAQMFVEEITNRAKACIASNPDIKPKEEIAALFDRLKNENVVLESGSDDLRVKFVHAQGCTEQVLSCALVLGEIKNLVGVIHTPTPSTPLCTEVENLDIQLLDESIRYDLEKLLTVRARTVILRDFLSRGGNVYVAYPKGGLEKRSRDQQEVYKRELANYADVLFDSMLSCSDMEPDKIGATYFFRTISGEVFLFSIKAKQANDPKDYSEWGLWMGEIDNPVIRERANEILDYLEANDGPHLRETFL